MYANENKGAYPPHHHRAFELRSASARPPGPFGSKYGVLDPFSGAAGTARPNDNDVCSAIFLLLRTQDITSEVFTCPSSNAEKWDLRRRHGTRRLNYVNWPTKLQEEPELQLSEPLRQ